MWLTCGDLKELGTHAFEEVDVLPLEMVRRLITAPGLRTLETHFYRRIEQQREIGFEPFLYQSFEGLNMHFGDSAARALISVAGVGKTIAQHPIAPLQG